MWGLGKPKVEENEFKPWKDGVKTGSQPVTPEKELDMSENYEDDAVFATPRHAPPKRKVS